MSNYVITYYGFHKFERPEDGAAHYGEVARLDGRPR